MIVKEEGQSLIHAANTWGDKAASTSSAEGRDLIQTALHRLQQGWDDLISGLGEARTALESCLLQWSDFDDSSDQIQRWLKDMERKVKDTELKADLSEKKGQLQKTKVRLRNTGKCFGCGDEVGWAGVKLKGCYS